MTKRENCFSLPLSLLLLAASSSGLLDFAANASPQTFLEFNASISESTTSEQVIKAIDSETIASATQLGIALQTWALALRAKSFRLQSKDKALNHVQVQYDRAFKGTDREQWSDETKITFQKNILSDAKAVEEIYDAWNPSTQTLMKELELQAKALPTLTHYGRLPGRLAIDVIEALNMSGLAIEQNPSWLHEQFVPVSAVQKNFDWISTPVGTRFAKAKSASIELYDLLLKLSPTGADLVDAQFLLGLGRMEAFERTVTERFRKLKSLCAGLFAR